MRQIESNKSIKIKNSCPTKDDGPFANYLIVENGKAKLIVDRSHRRYGSPQVFTYECTKLLTGLYEYDQKNSAMVFIPVANKESLGKNMPYFQCKTENREFVF